MSEFRKINRLLQTESSVSPGADDEDIAIFASYLSKVENLVVVVSDMARNTSRIYCGKFADSLGLKDYTTENSIWEKAILDLMPEEERDEKYRAELRFFHYLRHLPRETRPNYYLASRLRFTTGKGIMTDVLHKMHYVYADDGESIRYAICTYGPLTAGFSGRSVAVSSLTGVSEELTSTTEILSSREIQILRLIDSGKKTAEIAGMLSVSPHTVNRHRQNIIGKLQAKNSVEACSLAKALQLM